MRSPAQPDQRNPRSPRARAAATSSTRSQSTPTKKKKPPPPPERSKKPPPPPPPRTRPKKKPGRGRGKTPTPKPKPRALAHVLATAPSAGKALRARNRASRLRNVRVLICRGCGRTNAPAGRSVSTMPQRDQVHLRTAGDLASGRWNAHPRQYMTSTATVRAFRRLDSDVLASFARAPTPSSRPNKSPSSGGLPIAKNPSSTLHGGTHVEIQGALRT